MNERVSDYIELVIVVPLAFSAEMLVHSVEMYLQKIVETGEGRNARV